ncbi:hypothetical protein XENOCAPTIV_010236 [Xenoophorus captivus]|uniref:Uncharacterized protein n=1 Tax=Xenoophorus captivus TaxID=1517983 RepID=A0ABV0QZQ3_9TELE
MSKNSRAVGRKVGNNASGVVALMFMSSSLVRELRVPSQKTILKQKTKQNTTHQHAEATVCGAILGNETSHTKMTGVSVSLSNPCTYTPKMSSSACSITLHAP